MNFSLLHNLQLNREQKTLCETQQRQLLEVIGRLLYANYDPREGSILIVRTWADGTFEKILSGDLMLGKASDCHTQKRKYHPNLGLQVVNDAHCNSADLVDREVSSAIECNTPGTFYYNKIDAGIGSIYAEDGHYVLSLPLENGRIIASFRANYCQRRGDISSSISEPWQHRLMLTGLAEAFCTILSQDQRLIDSFDEIISAHNRRGLTCYGANSALVQKCLSHERMKTYRVIHINNSKMPILPRVAYA